MPETARVAATKRYQKTSAVEKAQEVAQGSAQAAAGQSQTLAAQVEQLRGMSLQFAGVGYRIDELEHSL